jgi:acyl-CoA synthetase (AMP-forming)/AMP-acid ligase II
VRECAALGVADADLGQAIHLVASPAAGATTAALHAALARDLPTFMLPRLVHWRDSLPINANGKLDRAMLAQTLITDRQDSAA